MAKPELKGMHCPFLRSMLSAAGAPAWDQKAREMEVEDLVKFVQNQPGDGSLDKVLKFFAVHNHGVGSRIQRAAHLLVGSGGRFSTELIGSDGDHEGGSHIYNPETGEFDAQQCRQFTSFSQDGRTMSVEDFGAAIVDANKRHGGSAVNALRTGQNGHIRPCQC
ncbi:MAG: hypothetical protein O2968_17745 [Acidobacteria bacterium]|nr:hypothetical protein [Acidobacteriota bacterium]